MAASCGKDDKRQTKSCDACIGDGIRHNLLCCTKDSHERVQKQQRDPGQTNAKDSQKRDSVPSHIAGAFLITAPHGKIKVGRATDAKQQSEGGGDGRKRKCHIGSGIAQHADTLADKDLVHDIIKRADQKTYDGRDAEFCN